MKTGAGLAIALMSAWVAGSVSCASGETLPDGGARSDASDRNDASNDPSDGASDDAGDSASTDGASTDEDAATGDAGELVRGTWISLAPLARGPRQETAVVELRGEIYVIGGFNASPVMVPAVEVYSPADNQWRDAADLPLPLHHANAAAANGKIYVLGFLVAGFAEDGRGFAYDPDRNEWTDVAPMLAGRERGASAIATFDDRIYVIGGLRNRQAVADTDVYDPITNLWTELPALPRPSDHVVAGAIGDRIFVAGGRSGGIGGLTDRVDVLDPIMTTWSLGPAMPTGRGGAASAVLGGRLYVFGGEGNRAAPSGVFAETEAYDAAQGAWLVLSPMMTPRHGTGAAAFGDRIYVPGGADVQAFSAVATHEAFVPNP